MQERFSGILKLLQVMLMCDNFIWFGIGVSLACEQAVIISQIFMPLKDTLNKCSCEMDGRIARQPYLKSTWVLYKHVCFVRVLVVSYRTRGRDANRPEGIPVCTLPPVQHLDEYAGRCKILFSKHSLNWFPYPGLHSSHTSFSFVFTH